MLKKLRKIIQNLKLIKWDFKNPQNCNFLLYDSTIGFALNQYIDKKKIFILNVRKRASVFFLFFKSIIKNAFNWNFQKYIYEVIQSVNPKIIITNIDNNKSFWELKKI